MTNKRRARIAALLVPSVLTIAAALSGACQSSEEMEMQTYLSGGRELYALRCQNCHGERGEGLGELAPPLTDSLWLQNNKKSLACLIKNGLEGEITVNGKKYNEKMPAFKELSDIEIAQLIVFVTNQFGNKHGHYPYQKVTKDLSDCK